MKKIVLQNLTKNFGDIPAVDHLDLEIEGGEFFSLIGPTACGKSTLLKMIAGLIEPTSGNIYFDNENVNQLTPRERKVRMIFENYALFPHMKVYDEAKFSNLSFPLKIHKKPLDKLKARLLMIIDRIGIGSAIFEKKPGELSEGQKQQVALGRALAIPPEVMLFDEPLKNLDPISRAKAQEELLQLHKEMETTTVYVTHNLTEAFSMGDRIGVMSEGRLLQVDTPSAIKDRPADELVKNLIDSHVTSVRNAFS